MVDQVDLSDHKLFQLEGTFGLGEVFHFNIRGVLKYRLEVISGMLIDGCEMKAV